MTELDVCAFGIAPSNLTPSNPCLFQGNAMSPDIHDIRIGQIGIRRIHRPVPSGVVREHGERVCCRHRCGIRDTGRCHIHTE